MASLMDLIQLHFMYWIFSILSYVGIRMIWYSPSCFGKQWMKLTKVKQGELNSVTFATTAIVAILASSILLVLLDHIGAKTVYDGMHSAFYIWLGFIATSHFSRVLWAKAPLELYLIDVGSYLAVYLTMGGLLAYSMQQLI